MIRREIGIFLVVGSLTVIVDYLTYQGLLLAGLGYSPAKAFGFLAGTVFAYFANKLWTFGHRQASSGSAWRFALLYATTLMANVSINLGVLALADSNPYRVKFAFLIATGVSACLNFVGMKLLVFKPALIERNL